MRSRGVLIVLATVVVTGCTKDEPSLPAVCLGSERSIARALDGAPRRVALPDGTLLSECVKRVRSDGDLQVLGGNLSRVADDLGVQARAGDHAAAARLGFLAGAVRRGSGEHGIGAELAHRIESAARRVDEVPALQADLERGLDAGRAHG